MTTVLLARVRLAHLTPVTIIGSVAARQTRGIGWLIGPPPKPGSKEHKIKRRRLILIALVVAGSVKVCQYTSLYDDSGEFRPIFRPTSIEREMERASHEALTRQQAGRPIRDQ
jgi:hypothetical protein